MHNLNITNYTKYFSTSNLFFMPFRVTNFTFFLSVSTSMEFLRRSKIKGTPEANPYSMINIARSFKTVFKKNVYRLNKVYILDIINSHVIHYPTPVCLTYAWSFGSLAGVTLVFQIISGVSLAMHYAPDMNLAFTSVEYIMRDVPGGWFIRYSHSNGASMFFIVIYAHIARGIYYGSYMKPREYLWFSGIVLFFLMMGTAFTGYVLPWGQMSFWGATVITSMVTIVPMAGGYITEWLWGGYVIRNPTLKRFFVLHFILPFVLVGITFLHLALLHKVGSNSPIGSDTGVDDVPFYSLFVSKDLFAFSIYLLVYAILIFYYPNYLNHPDNYIPADPYETPLHVVPEWYFLPYYCILRSIPGKNSGILAMFGSIMILFFLPRLSNSLIRNTTFRPVFRIFLFTFLADFVLLFHIGCGDIRKQTVLIYGAVLTAYYFFFFLVLFPLAGIIETRMNYHLLEEELAKKKNTIIL